jgi:hypothetical protein
VGSRIWLSLLRTALRCVCTFLRYIPGYFQNLPVMFNNQYTCHISYWIFYLLWWERSSRFLLSGLYCCTTDSYSTWSYLPKIIDKITDNHLEGIRKLVSALLIIQRKIRLTSTHWNTWMLTPLLDIKFVSWCSRQSWLVIQDSKKLVRDFGDSQSRR